MSFKEFCKKHKTEIIIGGVAVIVGIGCILYTRSKTNALTRLLEEAIDDASKNIPVDISQNILDRAMTKAVDREVKNSIAPISRAVLEDIEYTIKSEVKSVVESSAVDVQKSVSNEIIRQVSNINISNLRDEVSKTAKELTIEKLDSNMDSLLQDFNTNLSNVSKIYSSIADNITKKETVIKVV